MLAKTSNIITLVAFAFVSLYSVSASAETTQVCTVKARTSVTVFGDDIWAPVDTNQPEGYEDRFLVVDSQGQIANGQPEFSIEIIDLGIQRSDLPAERPLRNPDMPQVLSEELSRRTQYNCKIPSEDFSMYTALGGDENFLSVLSESGLSSEEITEGINDIRQNISESLDRRLFFCQSQSQFFPMESVILDLKNDIFYKLHVGNSESLPVFLEVGSCSSL
jgi:hypothetical protein